MSIHLPDRDGPGGLWSLWDMLNFQAGPFVQIMYFLGWIEAQGDEIPRLRAGTIINEDLNLSLRENLKQLRLECRRMGLDMAVRYIDDPMIARLKVGEPLRPWLQMIGELRGRVVDQLMSELILRIPPDRAIWYRRPRRKWERILEAYPAVLSDVEEAAKCFACERYAAAVHHTLLVVEHGLLDLGTKIGVNDPKSGWTSVTNRLAKILKDRPEDRSPYVQSNIGALEQIHGTVEGLKNAWRNKVDHAQNVLRLMTSEFTPEIAEEIILATRAFMRRLATELP